MGRQRTKSRGWLTELLTSPWLWIVVAVAAIGLRVWFVFVDDWHSGDYIDFLAVWVEYIREHGYWHALADTFSDYNVLYIYFLTLISYIPGESVYAIKLLSVAADLVMAWYGARIVGVYRPRQQWMARGTFALILLSPVTWIDSAIWSQCDSLYTAALLASVYYIICRRRGASMVALGLAFALKLQTILILPLFFVLLLKGIGRVRDILLMLAVFVATLVPAWLLGRSWESLLMIYIHQGFGSTFSGSMSSLLLPNAYPMYVLLSTATVSALMGAYALVVVAMGWWTVRRKRTPYDAKFIVTLGMLALTAGTFLLPGMHERYVYPAAVLSVVWLFYAPRQWWITAGMTFVTVYGMNIYLCGCGYYAFDWLYNWPFPMTMIPRVVYGSVVVALTWYYAREVVGRKKKRVSHPC